MEYFSVTTDADHMETMLKYSNGVRKVPVIVEDGEVSIGYQRGS